MDTSLAEKDISLTIPHVASTDTTTGGKEDSLMLGGGGEKYSLSIKPL